MSECAWSLDVNKPMYFTTSCKHESDLINVNRKKEVNFCTFCDYRITFIIKKGDRVIPLKKT